MAEKHVTYSVAHNMLNIVGFGSRNGIIRSRHAGAQEIAMEFAVRRYGANFFNGGAMPSGVVEHPGFIKDDIKRANFRRDLNDIHNNKTRGGQIGVLWEGAKYHEISIAPDRAHF